MVEEERTKAYPRQEHKTAGCSLGWPAFVSGGWRKKSRSRDGIVGILLLACARAKGFLLLRDCE